MLQKTWLITVLGIVSAALVLREAALADGSIRLGNILSKQVREEDISTISERHNFHHDTSGSDVNFACLSIETVHPLRGCRHPPNLDEVLSMNDTPIARHL
jgi:hypothetical protein